MLKIPSPECRFFGVEEKEERGERPRECSSAKKGGGAAAWEKKKKEKQQRHDIFFFNVLCMV